MMRAGGERGARHPGTLAAHGRHSSHARLARPPGLALARPPVAGARSEAHSLFG